MASTMQETIYEIVDVLKCQELLEDIDEDCFYEWTDSKSMAFILELQSIIRKYYDGRDASITVACVASPTVKKIGLNKTETNLVIEWLEGCFPDHKSDYGDDEFMMEDFIKKLKSVS